MIDTISFCTTNFEIKVENNLQSKACGKDEENFLFFYENGKSQYGKKYYYNDYSKKLININIVNEYGVSYLFVRITIPKIVSGGKHNLYSKGVKGYKKGIKFLEKKLIEIGIITNTSDFVINKIHLYRDIETLFEFKKYKSILDLIDCQRLKNDKRLSKYKDSLYLINNSHIKLFYNKTAEVIENNAIIPKEIKNKNIMRYEHRLKTKAKVDKIFNKYKIPNKINTFMYEEHYNSLNKFFNEQIREMFKIDFENKKNHINFFKIKSEISFDINLRKQIDYYHENGFSFNHVFEYLGIAFLLRSDFKIIYYMINKYFKTKTKIKYQKNKVRKKFEKHYKFIESNISEKYKELRSKLLREEYNVQLTKVNIMKYFE